MIDFSGANFTKIIKTVKTRNIKINDEIKIFKLSSSDFEIKIGDRVLAAEIIEDGKFLIKAYLHTLLLSPPTNQH